MATLRALIFAGINFCGIPFCGTKFCDIAQKHFKFDGAQKLAPHKFQFFSTTKISFLKFFTFL